MRLIVGASKIERQDMIESITIPVEAIIAEARRNGLTLPNDIKVYQMKTDEAVVYAFGMNSIGVSYAMTELPEEVFKAKVLGLNCHANLMISNLIYCLQFYVFAI